MLENLELIREELKWLHDYNSFDYDTMLEKDRKLFHDTTLKELDRIIGLVQNLVNEEQKCVTMINGLKSFIDKE